MPFWFGLAAHGSVLELVSVSGLNVQPAAGAGGDSYLPVVSSDGRYVLFASTAENLVALSSNAPVRTTVPAPLNVYLRDRSNGTTVLISADLNGAGAGNGDSLPVGISTNGRYALFESRASNLVPGDTNDAPDIFIRDLQNSTTLLVTASTNGTAADGGSYSAVMTPDGRFVAFASAADNLVAADTNGIVDVFVRDMASNSTVLVSAGSLPPPFGRFWLLPYHGSDMPVITPDGRYVAFYSTAGNLVQAPQQVGGVYVRDLKSGTTTCASSGALTALQSVGAFTNSVSFNGTISDDGAFVAFEAVAYAGNAAPTWGMILRYDAQTTQTAIVETNAATPPAQNYETVQNISLTPDGRFVAYVANALDTSGTTTAIRLWDSQTGTSSLISGDTNNAVAPRSISDSPLIDKAGRFVTFITGVPAPPTNEAPTVFHVFRRDVQTLATAQLDSDTNNAGSFIDPSCAPAVSADVTVVGFHRQEGAANSFNGKHVYDVLAWDSGRAGLEVISAHDPNLPSLTHQGASVGSYDNWSSRFICFWTEADDLVSNDTNGLRDVFMRDLASHNTVLVSVNTNGTSGDGPSTDSAISADGRYVAFTSSADDLVTGDTNRVSDVFLRDLQTGTTTLVSANGFGTGPGNGPSFSPLLSSNGQFVVFHSLANNIVPGISTSPGVENLFWKDLKNNKTVALTTNQVSSKVTSVSMTPDGAHVGLTVFSPSQVLVWLASSGSFAFRATGAIGALGPVALSPDGQILAYVTNQAGTSRLIVVDLGSNTNWSLGPYQAKASLPPRFSGDSRFLAYCAPAAVSNQNQVFVYDLATGTNLLVSTSYNGASAGNGDSDSPDISLDGRFVAYRSVASNLVLGLSNAVPNIYLFDRLSNSTALVSARQSGSAASHNRSSPPMFSGDGLALIFTSWAADLAPNDFNNCADVFELPLYGSSTSSNFAVSVSLETGSPGSNLLSWPVVAGQTYRAQFKQNLSDPAWQDLNAQIAVIGNRAYLTNANSSGAQRFYRIVAF